MDDSAANAANDFIEALQAVARAEGRFNRDPQIHMQNCLQDMQRVAVDVLRKHGIKPDREDDVIDGEPIPAPKHRTL